MLPEIVYVSSWCTENLAWFGFFFPHKRTIFMSFSGVPFNVHVLQASEASVVSREWWHVLAGEGVVVEGGWRLCLQIWFLRFPQTHFVDWEKPFSLCLWQWSQHLLVCTHNSPHFWVLENALWGAACLWVDNLAQRDVLAFHGMDCKCALPLHCQQQQLLQGRSPHLHDLWQI